MKSASSSQPVPIRQKIVEAASQFLRLLKHRAPWNVRSFDSLESDFREYQGLCQNYVGRDLVDSRCFELGCGQRPYRLCYLLASGVDASAVDLDRVFLEPSLRDVVRTLSDNGLERTAKTVTRYLLFDRSENKQFREFLGNRAGRSFDWPVNRIMRGPAQESESWPEGHFQFIFSEDVFEHIPRDALPIVCKRLHEHLAQNGVAFIRPMVFTGIQGGHNVEWYDCDENSKLRRCPPWDHLREWRYPSNTYLNRLTLAEYRALFSEHFEISEERVRNPQLGRAYMTESIRAELSDYSDEELFSNHVGFVLRRKS